MKQAISTVLTRVLVTLMGLFTTMAVGHRLGAAGLGEISLIVLAITVIMLMNNVVGGGALVYYTPRIARARLLTPAYAWAGITIGVATIVMLLVPLVPQRYQTGVLVMAGMQCLYSIHLNILLGQDRIGAFNLVSLLQAVVLLVAFLLIDPELPSARDYMLAGIIAFATTLLVSTIALFGTTYRRRRRDALEGPGMQDMTSVLILLMKQGGYMQGANALQLLNYRLSYWLISGHAGHAPLGLYSVGTQLAEGSWIAPRGLGTLLHSKVSNTADRERQVRLTMLVLRASLALAAVVLAGVLLVPDQVIGDLFGKEITGVRPLIVLLTPGMLAMAASQAFSHWFSGTAHNRHNTIGSGLGLVVTAIGGWLLIPRFGLEGAACTASLAYCGNVIYQAIVFRALTGARLRDALPRAADLGRLLDLVRGSRE